MKTMLMFADRPVVAGAGNLVLVALVALAAGGLYFPIRDDLVLNEKLDAARDRLTELEALQPLYYELTRSGQDGRWAELPCPPKQKLSQRDVMEVPALFAQIAQECGMELASVSPQVVSAGSGPRQLLVQLQASGPYSRLKDFLLGVVGMPSMEQIEKVEVRREAMHETFKLSLWLALD